MPLHVIHLEKMCNYQCYNRRTAKHYHSKIRFFNKYCFLLLTSNYELQIPMHHLHHVIDFCHLNTRFYQMTFLRYQTIVLSIHSCNNLDF